MKKVFVLVAMSLLISMYVLLAHIFSAIPSGTIKISFGFVPLAFGSMFFGPLIGGVIGALGDIIGVFLAPKGPYFPGITLDVFLAGLIYGLFLYKKPKTLIRISLAVLCVNLFVNIGLNTYWLTILTGKGYMAMLPGRIIKNAIMMPVQISMLYLIWRYAGSQIEKNFLAEPKRT
jgi:ECF transporter S component (folate family)